METGKIIKAIANAEATNSGEIRVHLSNRWFENNPMKRAERLFYLFGMHQNPDRNAVLIYLNPKKQKFAIVCDEGLANVTGSRFWQNLREYFARDLQSTHPQNALSLLIETLGVKLTESFPREISN